MLRGPVAAATVGDRRPSGRRGPRRPDVGSRVPSRRSAGASCARADGRGRAAAAASGTPRPARAGAARGASDRARPSSTTAGSRAPSPAAAAARPGRPAPAISSSSSAVQPAPDLRQRQVLRLEPPDEPEPREVRRAVLAARPGRPDGGSSPWLEVVADGPWGDPAEVGQLGQRIAFVIGHGRICDSVTSHCQYLDPDETPSRLHIASTSDRRGCGSDGIRGGSPRMDKESNHMPRIIAAILLVVVLAIGGGIIATTAYQAGVSTAVTTDRRRAGPSSPRSSSPPTATAGIRSASASGIFGFFADAVLPVHRVRPDPGHLLARRPGPARRLGRPAGGWVPGTGRRHDAGQDRSPWESRAHDTFDDWHRQAHDRRRPGARSGRDRAARRRRRRRPTRRGLTGAGSPIPCAPGRLVPGAHPPLRCPP